MRLRWGRSCWLRIYQLHQVLLLMLLLLLLLLREASEVVEHVSRCLLLVCRGKQLDSEALFLAWNGSCWNGNSALLLLLARLVGDVHAKLLDDAREGEGRLGGGGGDPGKLVRVHRQSWQLNLRVGDGQHVRQADACLLRRNLAQTLEILRKSVVGNETLWRYCYSQGVVRQLPM